MPPSKRNKDVARLIARSNNWTPEGTLPQLPVPESHTLQTAVAAQVARTKVKSTEVVTQAINLAPGVGNAKAVAKAKGAQAWKYPNYTIQRAESVELPPSNTKYFDHKDKDLPRRKQESNFLITINPNQRWSGFDSVLARQAFKNGITAVSTGNTFAETLIFGPKDREWYQNDQAADVIKSVVANASVEEGGKLHRMHCHIILEIIHYSQIQIDPKRCLAVFKEAFNNTPGVHGSAVQIKRMPYVQVKLLPQSNWTTVMRQYVKKAMAHAPAPGDSSEPLLGNEQLNPKYLGPMEAQQVVMQAPMQFS